MLDFKLFFKIFFAIIILFFLGAVCGVPLKYYIIAYIATFVICVVGIFIIEKSKKKN